MKEIDRTHHGSIEKPYVSVVVPFYNEEDCIKDCIVSLSKQDFEPFEIIAVDDGSTDGSVGICEQLKVEVLRQNHRGPGAARNLGARHAKGNILVLIDADMVFATDYVSRLVTPIISGEAIATCHWNEKVSNWGNPWARCETWFLERPDVRREPINIPEDIHIYRAVRKDFFLESGGFSENEGRGDDTSIARRTGVFSTAVPDAACYHRNAGTPKEVFENAVWQGRDEAAKSGTIARAIAAVLVHRNPAMAILRGLSLSLVKKEPRMLLYSMIFITGVLVGVFRGMCSGYYLK